MDDLLLKVGAFIVAIGLLVSVHEFGHFWVARRLGVKVLRFSIGASATEREHVLAGWELLRSLAG